MSVFDLFRRRELATILTSFILVICWLNNFVTFNAVNVTNNYVKTWSIIILAFSMGLGSIQLFRFESIRIRRRDKEWPLSVFSLFMLVATFSIAMIPPMGFNVYFEWILLSVMVPMDAVMWGLTGFAQVVAAYHSLRAKSFGSFIMIFAVALYLLWISPFTSYSKPIQDLGSWTFNYLNVGGSRGLTLAGVGGTIAIAARCVIGRERGYFR